VIIINLLWILLFYFFTETPDLYGAKKTKEGDYFSECKELREAGYVVFLFFLIYLICRFLLHVYTVAKCLNNKQFGAICFTYVFKFVTTLMLLSILIFFTSVYAMGEDCG
jgi:hypothetical protein